MNRKGKMKILVNRLSLRSLNIHNANDSSAMYTRIRIEYNQTFIQGCSGFIQGLFCLCTKNKTLQKMNKNPMNNNNRVLKTKRYKKKEHKPYKQQQ